MVETQILPNEIRVSAKSSFQQVVKNVFSLFRDQGFSNCKLVGRGIAAQITQDVCNYLQKTQSSKFTFDSVQTKSYNKQGNLVDEMHVMIFLRSNKHSD